MVKRTKKIEILVTDEELELINQKKTTARRGQWLRELALEQPSRKPHKQTDPELLKALNKIGSNLNQIARACNKQKGKHFDLLAVALQLEQIEKDFSEVLKYDR